MTAISDQPIFKSFKDKFFEAIYNIVTEHKLEIIKAERSRNDENTSIYIQNPKSFETVIGLEFDFSIIDEIKIISFPDDKYSDNSIEIIVKCLENTSVQSFLNKFKTLLESELKYLNNSLEGLPIEHPK